MITAISWIIFFVWLACFFARPGDFWRMIAGHLFVVLIFVFASIIGNPIPPPEAVPLDPINNEPMFAGLGLFAAVFIINLLLLPISALGIYFKRQSEKLQFPLSKPDGSMIMAEIDD